ncbi:dihydroorotase [Laspinema olomoucense]|uniref:Dihydroorotase n=1 Tax=Laspinema olomoucense D3b TaxID=2953688 RepID=A0ABT2N7Z8_9CYAN|nr:MULTISPECIES: dihydroorotase [unclassified Laspinema]MCT7977865.1 dihydroorotase [Laspinema sp. D3b]MCT7990547.1 dihydroorotase [Laspinema sp. D3a]
MNELLQQVRIINPVSGEDTIADVGIVNGAIAQIAPEIADWESDTQVRNCQGLILGPGLVDLYSHSGEPGFEERETLTSLMHSARSGGFTQVAILPDTHPPVDNPGGLAFLQQKVQGIRTLNDLFPPPTPSLPKLHFWGALTLGIKGEQMTELAELEASGIVGFADGQPIADLALLRRILEYLNPWGKPVALWPCSRKLAGEGVVREGTASIRLGLPGNPTIAETTALAALLEIVAATGTPVHIMRVSTQRGVQLIEAAKAQGLPITASTSWMHLLVNAAQINNPALFTPYCPSLHLEPPVGNPQDQQALIAGVKSGVIDAIAIDHTPYTYEEKTVAFAESPPGAIGLELALPLLWQHLVTTEQLSPVELWRALSSNPAKCLQQTPTAIAPGTVADFTLFDPQQSWRVTGESLKSLSSNTPWLEREIIGRVVEIWC